MGNCPPTRGALASSDVDDVHVKEAADEIVRAGRVFVDGTLRNSKQPPFGWWKNPINNGIILILGGLPDFVHQQYCYGEMLEFRRNFIFQADLDWQLQGQITFENCQVFQWKCSWKQLVSFWNHGIQKIQPMVSQSFFELLKLEASPEAASVFQLGIVVCHV